MGESEVRTVTTLIAPALRGRQDAGALKTIAYDVQELVAAFPPSPLDFPGHG